MKRVCSWLLAALVVGLIFPLGCKSNTTEKQNGDGRNSAVSAAEPVTPPDPATLGTINGIVIFSGASRAGEDRHESGPRLFDDGWR